MQVDETTAEMKEDVKTLDRVIRELDDTASRAKVLRNEVSFAGLTFSEL